MFEIDGKYGSLEINGKSINIEKTNTNDLEKYLDLICEKEKDLINIQNEYLSKLLS